MWLYKLRSGIAIFCIAFGIFAVVMLLSLGSGFHESSLRNINGIVSDDVIVWQNAGTKSYNGYPQGHFNYITIIDIIELPRFFSDIQAISPQKQQHAALSYAGRVYAEDIFGVTPDYARLRKIAIEDKGRFINQADVEQRSRVVVIGNKIKELLFAKKHDVIGSKILLNNIPFTVVGVMTKDWKNQEQVIISYQSYIELYSDKYVNFFWVLTKPDTDPAKFQQLLRSHFARKCHFDKNDKEALHFFSAREIFQFIRLFFIGIQLFLGTCGMMVLAVGSIGVANIMFLLVTERKYEIGLRKAVGATDLHILLQFLLEALIIIGIGGGLGLSMSFVTITVLQHIALPDWLGTPILSWTMAWVALVILAIVGLITGFFPARRAAKIDPIEALMM